VSLPEAQVRHAAEPLPDAWMAGTENRMATPRMAQGHQAGRKTPRTGAHPQPRPPGCAPRSCRIPAAASGLLERSRLRY